MNSIDATRLSQIPGLQELVHRHEVESTSTLALELARNRQLRLPALIIADRQTAGRGQPGRSWSSSEGSLTFSLVVSIEPKPLLPILTGLLVAEAIEQLLFESSFPETKPWIRLKWPNDLIIENRKFGGILVESPVAADRCAVLGIGLNVNNPPPKQRTDSGLPAGSLHQNHGPLDLNQTCLCVVSKLIAELDAPLPRVLDDAMMRRINERLFLRNQRVNFHTANNNVITASLLGIDPSGGIQLEENARAKTFSSGRLIVNATDGPANE